MRTFTALDDEEYRAKVSTLQLLCSGDTLVMGQIFSCMDC